MTQKKDEEEPNPYLGKWACTGCGDDMCEADSLVSVTQPKTAKKGTPERKKEPVKSITLPHTWKGDIICYRCHGNRRATHMDADVTHHQKARKRHRWHRKPKEF